MKQTTQVIIADENADFRAMLTETLERSGDITVVAQCSDGEALLAKTLELQPDILVFDTVLPKMDGLAALREIYQHLFHPRPAAFILSSFTSALLANEAADLGASCFMPKPCNLTALVSRIKNLSITQPQHSIGHAVSPAVALEISVTETIHKLGVPAHIMGHKYLRDAIMLSVENADLINAVTKELYPAVARMHGSTGSKVERAIRHAIECAWSRGDVEVLQEYFGYTISSYKGKPTNSEFISMIADKLRLQRLTHA